jgi:predicted TIM-barrel fold metal-dependent hydrolase
MRRRREHPPRPPLPLSPVSNGEWCPQPPTPRQRLAARLLGEEATRRARRHGLTRAEFLRTAAGTMTAFAVLNRVHGLDAWGDTAVLPVGAEACDDPAAAAAHLSDRWFVMDVQTHHVDLQLLASLDPDYAKNVCGLRFLPGDLSCEARAQLLGQATFVKEVLVDSETDVAVVSGLPGGTILPAETMAATRDLANQLAGSERVLSQAIVDPLLPPGRAIATDSLDHQVRDLGARALKVYTSAGGWFLDDERVSYPMLERARALGLRLVNVHKGLGGLVDGRLDPYLTSRDVPRASRDFPDLAFCVYHAGWNQQLGGNREFLRTIRRIPRRRRRRNVYAEIGSAFAMAFLDGPHRAAHLVGGLLKLLGSRRILWGTDSIWWGSPQWQIDAFKALRIPPAMRERFGYPALTRRIKRRILGGNAARLYGVDPSARRCAVPPGAFTALLGPGGAGPRGRSLRTYGPRTRREFLALLRWEARLRS